MKFKEALETFKINDGELTRQQLKEIYKKLSLQNHPDKGGDVEKMQMINVAYEKLQKEYSFKIQNDNDQNFEEDSNFWKIDDPEMEKAYKAIYNLPGIQIEICGFWMWVTGNTYAHKDILKKAGLYFAPKKVAWYWKPADYKSNGRGTTTLDEIRNNYGSRGLSATPKNMLTA